MAGLIDAGILKPELATSFATGYNQAEQTRNQLAQQKQQTELSQLKLEQLKQDRAMLTDLQTKLQAAGKSTDPNEFFKAMIQSGNPEYMTKGYEGMQRYQDLQSWAKLGVIEPAAPAMPAGAPAPTNALAAGAAPAAPMNAMVPAPVTQTPTAPVNALAPQPGADQAARAHQRIDQLLMFARTNPRMASQAMAEAKILQDQLELFSKRGPNKPAALQELEAYMAMTPEQKSTFEKLQKIKSPGSTTNVSISSPTGKSLSEPVGKRVDSSLAKAEGAAGMMENANMIREALNTGNIIAGPLSGPRTKFAQVLAAAGAGDKDKLQNTLSVTKGLAGLTLESRGELKGQGQITDPETKLLERARSGDMDLTLDEMQQVVNISQRLSKRLWENHQNLLRTMEKDPAAAGSIEYYRPTGQLAVPVGAGKSAADQNKEQKRPALSDIFKSK